MRGRAQGLVCLLVAASLALLPACAPRPTGLAPVTGGVRGARYLSQLAAREARATMVEAAGTLWARTAGTCDSCPRRRLPAVQVDVAMAWPGAFRLRAGSWFGTALDMGLEGDSITAYVPSEGAGVVLDAVADSLGVRDPGGLAVRVACAAWRPPETSWMDGRQEGDLLVLRWCEVGDSVALAVDGTGRPSWVCLLRGGGRWVRVDYERWQLTDGVDWPVVLRVETLDSGAYLTVRFDRVRFASRPDRERLALRLPGDVDRIESRRLIRMLGGPGAVR